MAKPLLPPVGVFRSGSSSEQLPSLGEGRGVEQPRPYFVPLFTGVRGRGILRSWALLSRRHQRSWAPVAPQNSEVCPCYIWATRDHPPSCALEVSGEKSRLAPVRYPCPLNRGKPNLVPDLSVQHLVRYSPGRSLAQSPTASGRGVLLISRTTQKRKAPICSRATVIACALASSMICVGSGPLGRSPSLSVGACALAASSACLRNSVGSLPCSVRMSSVPGWCIGSLLICPSFRPPSGGSSPAIDYKQSAPPEPGGARGRPTLSRPLFTRVRGRGILRTSP